MRVSFTAEARNDLRDIAAYVALDSSRQSVAILRDLRAKSRGIADAPRGYPLVPHYEDSGLRRRVAGSYLIFYRIAADRISILRILHGARDFDRLFRTRRR